MPTSESTLIADAIDCLVTGLKDRIRDLEGRLDYQTNCWLNHEKALEQLLQDNIKLRSRLDFQELEPFESSLRSPEAAEALVDLFEANPRLAVAVCGSEAMRGLIEEALENEIKSDSHLYDKVYDTVRDALRDASVRISI